MGDRLRPLWDVDDLDASERRFRAQLGVETTPAGRAEVLTQLARIEGLRERSSGRPGAGLAQFERAFERGAHARARRRERGMDGPCRRDRRVLRRPRCPLLARPALQNLGWARYEAGDAAGALEAFRLALASRERDDPRAHAREAARYAVGKALRALELRGRGGSS